MALLVCAVALISLNYDVAAGVVLAFSFWCRPDIVLMAPFLIILLSEWKRVLRVGVSATVIILLYWVIFVRAIPSEAAFPWIIDWRIFAVYLVFGFGPVVFLLALFGFSRVSMRQWLLPLSSAFPLLYYFRDLGSPKYILGLALGTTLAAAWTIASSGRVVKVAIVAAAAWFWFISITPFGIFGPARGGHWVAPAGHGPVAFGSYLSFYQHIRDGFFGVRYGALEQTWELVLRSRQLDPRPMRVIGSSDDHMLNLICEQHRIARSSVPVSIDQPGYSINQPTRLVMLFNGYTRLSYLTAPGAEPQVRQWLAAGQVARLPGDNSQQPLPLIVEIGPTAINGSKELGQRILWADARAHSSGLAPLQYFTADYGAFCFVSLEPTTTCPQGTLIWGNWWPTVYYKQHADRARAALVGGRK